MTHTGLKAHVITNQNTRYNNINRAEAEPPQLYIYWFSDPSLCAHAHHIKYTYCRSGPRIHVTLSNNTNNNNNQTFLLDNPVQEMTEPNAFSWEVVKIKLPRAAIFNTDWSVHANLKMVIW